MNLINMIINLIRQLLGGGVDLNRLIQLLKDRFENHDGKLDLPDGLLPKEMEQAVESFLNSDNLNLTDLPIGNLDSNTLKDLMRFLENNK